ncbi:type II toxin-antitoxin system VapC family toxin [Sphingomonas sp.]|uniref:type II toxin-antitoxin system VapC family toxin n=1 Tax=Sphingomonas sp. TaxID=28214 RepID=UPI0035C83BF3
MSEAFFDTNILIDWLNARTAAVAELKLYDRYRISRIVWTEVLAGEPDATRRSVERLIAPFEIVEVDAAIALHAAEIRHHSRLKLMDALIYATARVHGALLVTRNTKDFPPGTPGIHVPYTLYD